MRTLTVGYSAEGKRSLIAGAAGEIASESFMLGSGVTQPARNRAPSRAGTDIHLRFITISAYMADRMGALSNAKRRYCELEHIARCRYGALRE